jgi:uncharacterized coiled-coil DUF342 family protein
MSRPPGKHSRKPKNASYVDSLISLQRVQGKAAKILTYPPPQDAAKAKVDLAFGNKDSESEQQRSTLRKELASIRESQQKSKETRTTIQRKIDDLETKLKSRIEQQKEARKKVDFRSVDEINTKIDRLQKDVDTGTMKLVDEKKALAEISNLNRIKKNFGSFQAADDAITDLKKQISELKKSRDDPEQKALSERYTQIQKQLDEIKAKHDEAYQNRNHLKEEQTAAWNEKQEKFQALKSIRDKYYDAKRAAKAYEREAAKQRAERRKAERDAWEAGKRKEIANRKLEEASAPAYQDQIYTAESILRFLDPSLVEAKQETGPSKFAAAAERTVDASGFKGMKVVKRDETEDYFVGGGGKKKGKGKGSRKTEAPTGPVQLNPRLIEDCASMGIDPPMSAADYPAVTEKVQEKLTFWKKDQKRKTAENIANAQKEIERLNAEAHAANHEGSSGSTDKAKKVAQEHAGDKVNGKVDAARELEQEKDADKDVADEMKKASLEDKE